MGITKCVCFLRERSAKSDRLFAYGRSVILYLKVELWQVESWKWGELKLLLILSNAETSCILCTLAPHKLTTGVFALRLYWDNSTGLCWRMWGVRILCMRSLHSLYVCSFTVYPLSTWEEMKWYEWSIWLHRIGSNLSHCMCCLNKMNHRYDIFDHGFGKSVKSPGSSYYLDMNGQ